MVPFRLGKIRDYSYIIRSFSFRKFLTFSGSSAKRTPLNNLIPVNRIDLICIHARLLINDHRRLDLHPAPPPRTASMRIIFASLSRNGCTIFIRFGSSLYCFIVPKISISLWGRCTIYILPPGFRTFAPSRTTSSSVQRTSCLEIAFTSVGFFNHERHSYTADLS